MFSTRRKVSFNLVACSVVLSLVWTLLPAGGAFGRILFSDDFEKGDLRQWDVIGGTWKVLQIDNNHLVQTKEAGNPNDFRTLNIMNRAFGDFTMEARIWQVSQDHGANIYFHNDQSRRNPQQHSGYWFGISGALAAVGWGLFKEGAQGVWDALFSNVPLGWVRLRLKVKGKSATMWIQREGVDDDFQQVFEVADLFEETQADYPKGSIGLVVAGGAVQIDDVIVADDELAVEPAGKAAILWGQLKRENIR